MAHEHLDVSPAASLPAIKGNADKKSFRTVAEIEANLARGGLGDEEAAGLWDSMYLTPAEIGGLLYLVNSRVGKDYAHLLHAIPAYTGMRRG